MIRAEKKVWSTPRLRVFIRTKTEENVLGGCKLAGLSGVYTLAVGCRGRYSCSPVCYDLIGS